MKRNNPIESRHDELIKTGLCNDTDFTPEKFTRIEFYTFDFPMSKEARDLLEKAVKVLKVADNQLERLERITKAILKIEGVTTAEACHIAEAIQGIR
jgi:predicted ATPase with chaperone activity